MVLLYAVSNESRMTQTGDEDDDTTFVGAEVSTDRSEEWDEFIAESGEFSSKAQLIRAGVSRLIRDASDNTEEEIEALRDDIDTVLREIRDARDDIDGLEDEFSDVEEIAEETVYRMERIESDYTDDDS